MQLTKLQAAANQLDCAIRLFFNEDDIASAITLSRASLSILRDIYPIHSDDDFDHQVSEALKPLGWKSFNKVANALKHADNDPQAVTTIDPLQVMVGVGIAVIYYGRIAKSLTDEMKAWNAMMAVLEPKVFGPKINAEAEGSWDFEQAVKHYSDAGHSKRMELGRNLLAELKNPSPDGSPIRITE